MTVETKFIGQFCHVEERRRTMAAERRMIAARFVDEALDCLRQRGIATEPLLSAVGLPPQLSEPVSAERYGALWLAIAAAIDDEFFGLGSRPMRLGSFTLLCHCVLHAETLEQALHRALRFLRVALDDPRGELLVKDSLAQILLKDTGDARSAFAYRTYWIILHGITCWLVGRRIPLRLVDFRCAEPDRSADYGLFFGAPVRFGQPVSRLAFDAAYLKLPAVRTERALKQFLRSAPANILVRYRYDAGLAATTRNRLRQQLPSAWPSFDELARQMRLPASTLRHRLHQEGQSFSAIKNEIRRDLAIEWLLNSKRGISDIAVDLGFAEPSAFHRAFRKWTLKSPGAFRREMRMVHNVAGAAANADPEHPNATKSRKARRKMTESDYS
jgi:AraC-like DNA-binding protein